MLCLCQLVHKWKGLESGESRAALVSHTAAGTYYQIGPWPHPLCVAPSGHLVSQDSVITASSLFIQEFRASWATQLSEASLGNMRCDLKTVTNPLSPLTDIFTLAYCSWHCVNACLLRLPKVGYHHTIKQNDISHFASRKWYLSVSISLVTA